MLNTTTRWLFIFIALVSAVPLNITDEAGNAVHVNRHRDMHYNAEKPIHENHLVFPFIFGVALCVCAFLALVRIYFTREDPRKRR
jgi:hypothetical protein